MSFEGFFESVVRNLKLEHKRLLCTPRARADLIKNEIVELLEHLNFYLQCGDISEDFAKNIKKQIKEIDFDNLAHQRIELKRKQKQKTV